MFKSIYAKQAQLLLRCLPEVGKQTCFALKGGTAINFFFRPMPRLSVDIDLAYLPLGGRDKALADISRALEDIATDVRQRVGSTHVQISRAGGMATKLVVALDDAQIKVEPNHVLRGSVYPPEVCDLCPEAQSFFELRPVPTLSTPTYTPERFARRLTGNIRATCSMCGFADNEGFTSPIRRAFVVYFPPHDRPMHELLTPQFKKDFAETYATEFAEWRRRVPLSVFERDATRIAGLILSGLMPTRGNSVTMKQENPTGICWKYLICATCRPCSGNCKTSGGWIRTSAARCWRNCAGFWSVNGRGAPGRDRTCDPGIRNPMLCPTELQAHCGKHIVTGAPKQRVMGCHIRGRWESRKHPVPEIG